MGAKRYPRRAAAFSADALPLPPRLMATAEPGLGEKPGEQPKWHKGDTSYTSLASCRDKDLQPLVSLSRGRVQQKLAWF